MTSISSRTVCKYRNHFIFDLLTINQLLFPPPPSLTKREREERQYKKQLLNIAKEHEKARELERIQRYHMPQDLKKGEKCKCSMSRDI